MKSKNKFRKMVHWHDENQELAILRGTVENTNEAFVTIDENHTVIFFNKAAERIFGYGRDEVMGQDLDVIMAPGCSRDHRGAVERYINTKVPVRLGHVTKLVATRKNGEKFPANISFSESRVDGKLYFTGIMRDLTETKLLQEQLTRAERLASLGQVVAEITHEIKNPLMMIGGFARQLIQQTKDDTRLKKLHIISDEVSRLEQLIHELREFYTPRTLMTEEVDIDNLLQEVYSLIKDACKRKNIRTQLMSGKKPAVVKGDSHRLKQVFLNLIRNSIEAMENGGNLSVQYEVNGDLAEISIADDGCGIPEDKLEKIFSPFYTTKQLGTGLGLSISKGIIEDHEGSSFTLKSEEGKGTVFKVTLPLSRALLRNSTKEKQR